MCSPAAAELQPAPDPARALAAESAPSLVDCDDRPSEVVAVTAVDCPPLEPDEKSNSSETAAHSKLSHKVHQGKWARLKQAEREWRTRRVEDRGTDPDLCRCLGKIFEVFEAQSVVLRDRLHESIVRNADAGRVRDARESVDRAFGAMEALASEAMAVPLPRPEAVGRSTIAERAFEPSGRGTVAIRAGDRLEVLRRGAEDAPGWAYVKNLSLCLPANVGWVPAWVMLAGSDADALAQEAAPEVPACARNAPVGGVAGSGLSNKALNTARRKRGKRFAERHQDHEELVVSQPELARCLELVYKDLAKSCMRVKYALHIQLQRELAQFHGSGPVEALVDVVVQKTGALLMTLAAEARSSASTQGPPACGEEAGVEDCEAYLFRAARLGELAAVLESME